MPLNDKNIELRLNEELKRLNDTLRSCKLVEETINTPGWREIIEPLIDKTLGDVLGAKLNGRWHGGLVDRARKDEKREFYVGYKQALIDFHRRIYAYNDNIKNYEDRKEALVSKSKPQYTVPMKDMRYGKDSRSDNG